MLYSDVFPGGGANTVLTHTINAVTDVSNICVCVCEPPSPQMERVYKGGGYRLSRVITP